MSNEISDYEKCEGFKDWIEQKEFEMWAFGNSPIFYHTGIMHTWNSKHGDVLWIRGDELIGESLKKMIEMYREVGCEQPKQNS